MQAMSEQGLLVGAALTSFLQDLLSVHCTAVLDRHFPPTIPELAPTPVQRSAQEQEALYHTFLHNARFLAFRFARSTKIDAEDLLQELAVYLWIKQAKIFSATDPIAYAYTTSYHFFCGLYKKHSRRRAIAYFTALPVDDLLYIQEGEGW